MPASAAPHSPAPGRDVTTFLRAWSAGDATAQAQLIPLVYEQLRALARAHLRREPSGHTLQPTALVHEVYLRMVNQRECDWRNRAQFFSIAARMMRRILVDHARARATGKRGGGEAKVSLDEAAGVPHESATELVALDDALENLAKDFPRQSEVVELKFFGGMEAKEIALALQISEKTVLRDWNFARLWLCRELGASEPSASHHAGT